MKSLFKILGVFVVLYKKAQQTYPLNTFPDDVPFGSYMKDLDNELLPFVGTWVSNFNKKTLH